MINIYTFCIYVIGFLLSYNAHAFKVDTHVWIAQEVINDAQDGSVSFELGEKVVHVALSNEVVHALTSYPSYYRMGNIGPDAMPDIISGQTAIHPGVPGFGGWKTDDWLEWIMQRSTTAKEKAFALGFLGHAAADVFAHTYVNTYVGDHFDLSDGEQDVEIRHIALESYISNKTPLIADANGNLLGEAHTLVSTPSEFIADSLIFNSEVSKQYSRASLYHFYYVHELRERIQSLLDGPVLDIEKQLIKEAGKSLGLNLTDAQIGEIYSLQSSIKAQINNNLQELQGLHKSYFNEIANVIDLQKELSITFNGISSYTLLQSKIASLNDEIQDATNVLGGIQRTLSSINGRECTGGWKKVCIVCSAVCEGWSPIILYYDNPAWLEQDALVRTLITRRADLINGLASVEADVEVAIRKINLGRKNALNTIDDTFSIMVDLAQIYGGSTNPIRGHLENWKKDVYLGMVAYVDANAHAIRNAMQNDDVLSPYSDWLNCWGRSIAISLPSPINNSMCKATSEFNNARLKLAGIRDQLSQINPAHKLISDLEAELTGRITTLATNLAYELTEKVSNIDLDDLMKAFDEEVTSTQLNNYFSTHSAVKKLIDIPDISSRVDAEMAIKNGYFDKSKYSVVRNSIVLAKLALLDENGLNQLALAAGLDSGTIYGPQLFGFTGSVGDSNILFDAIGSIDGNHQWMPLAPPAPRSDAIDSLWPEFRKYGYSTADDGNTGFRFWQDPNARKKLFLQIFKGPLAPGIEYPAIIAKTKILPADYPYRPCIANPYPLDIKDQSCIAAWLIPILNNILF